MPGLPLSGKRVLVVGGETPPGRALVIALAERGAAVAIASLTAATEADFAINSALNELWAMRRDGVALVIDASDADALREAVARAERELGALDAAAVVAEAHPALGVMREALADRPAIEVAAGASAEQAVELVEEAL